MMIFSILFGCSQTNTCTPFSLVRPSSPSQAHGVASYLLAYKSWAKLCKLSAIKRWNFRVYAGLEERGVSGWLNVRVRQKQLLIITACCRECVRGEARIQIKSSSEAKGTGGSAKEDLKMAGYSATDGLCA